LINGKLDMLEAEGLADLINAETESQVQLSIAQLKGEHSKLYEDLREELV